MAQLLRGDSSLFNIKDQQLWQIDALDSHLGVSRQEALDAVVEELKASGHIQCAQFQNVTTRVRKQTEKAAKMYSETSSSGASSRRKRKRSRSELGLGWGTQSGTLSSGDPLPPADVSGSQKVKK